MPRECQDFGLQRERERERESESVRSLEKEQTIVVHTKDTWTFSRASSFFIRSSSKRRKIIEFLFALSASFSSQSGDKLASPMANSLVNSSTSSSACFSSSCSERERTARPASQRTASPGRAIAQPGLLDEDIFHASVVDEFN